jgi:hypothetical protein
MMPREGQRQHAQGSKASLNIGNLSPHLNKDDVYNFITQMLKCEVVHYKFYPSRNSQYGGSMAQCYVDLKNSHDAPKLTAWDQKDPGFNHGIPMSVRLLRHEEDRSQDRSQNLRFVIPRFVPLQAAVMIPSFSMS